MKEITGIQDADFLHAALKVCMCCERRLLMLSTESGEFRSSQSIFRVAVCWCFCGVGKPLCGL